jgi:septum site-determining protein MinC
MTQNAAPSPQTATPNAFDMKAGHFTLPALMIKGDDPDELDRFLAEQVAKLPQFFERAPLVIDLSQFPADRPLDNFAMMVGLVRGHGMIPVGVRGASTEQAEQAQMLELAIMPRHRSARDNESVQAKAAPAVAPTPRDAMVVDKPVRSGQRIYADGSDLILLSGISSGAEVMADGNVHAYGPIRGRVLAGVRENTRARIFCRDLGAELVAIAGRYRVAEDLPRKYLGRSVQISLLENSLQFSSL